MLERRSAKIVCCCLVFPATHASAWIPCPVTGTCRTRADNYIHSSFSSASPRPLQSMRRSTALSLSPRDLGRRDESNGEEEEAAAAAAQAARESLERMWSSSPSEDSPENSSSSNSSLGDEERGDLRQEVELTTGAAIGLPELAGEGEDGAGAEGLEVRRENPFPSSSERGALEASAAAQKALVAGKRGLIIDIEPYSPQRDLLDKPWAQVSSIFTPQVKQLDDAHPEFEPELLIHFVTQVSKALAAVSGKAKVMLRGHDLAARATETLQRSNMEAAELGISPREDVSFCSLKTSDPDQEGDPDSMRKFASKVTSELGEDERLIVMACPKSNADVIVMREVMEAAKGRPVLLLNPRMVHMPRETNDYDTVYLLRQFKVQAIKSDPRKEARKSPFKISPQQRKQQHIFSELGQVIPKVLTTRAFPDDFKLYIDVDGEGFQLEYTYDRKPHPTTVCLRAQSAIKEAQREITRQQRIEGDKKREQEMKERWDNDEDDDDDDDDDDIVMPRKLTNEEIDAMLRD